MNQQTPEEMEIARRRKLADALGSMAMQRSPSGQMVGRVFVGTHPLEHIAKALQAYGSYKMNQDANNDAKALGEKQNAALIEGLRGFQQKMTGTPEKVAPYQAPSFDDADAATMQGNQTVTPAVPADPRGAYASLIQSQVPALQQMGMQGMIQLPQLEAQKAERADNRAFRTAEAEANRQARIDQLNLQHQMRMEQMAAQNASKEDMMRAQQQHQIELRKLAGALTAGMRQQPAPALTTIQDPKDPTKSITVDARTYNPATGAGVIGIAPPKQTEKAPPGYRLSADGRSMEAIPGGPADVKARTEAEKKASGGNDVSVALGTLRDAYDRLETGGGITSTQKSSLSNLKAAGSSSAVGQLAGRALGTANQSARNDIAMARPALLAALMKATGMSAKQMDSNAELKLWLSTATDPTLDVESNRRALDNIERKYLGGATGGWGEPSTTPPAAGGWSGQVIPKGR